MPASRASAASSGPASTSASTLTMTMCLPAAMAARRMARCRRRGCRSPRPRPRSSRLQQRPRRRRGSAVRRDPRRHPSRPAGRLPGRGRDRDRRSPRPRGPGVVGTWDRNIEPNLPAPIRPTRTGLPGSRRAASSCVRGSFRATRPRHLRGRRRGLQVSASSAPARSARSRGGRSLGPGRLADVVRDRAQRQVDDLARIGRDVGRRGVDEIAVEHQHASRACRSAPRCRRRATSLVTVSLSSVHSG